MDCWESKAMGKRALVFILSITLIAVLFLNGCCNQEENGMSKLKGCVMHSISIDVLGGLPIGVKGWISYDCQLPDFTIPGTVLGYTWDPINGEIVMTATLPWPCILERSIIWYDINCEIITSPYSWNRYDSILGANWSVVPTPPGFQHYDVTIYMSTLLAMVPGGVGHICLSWLCGPVHPLGISPKVATSFVTPV